MSKQGSGSDKEELGERNTAYHAGFLRPGPPLQYQATDIVHQATSETPHHPSRPPNFAQPWRVERPLSTLQTISERTLYSTPSPEAARISSMGNKNDSDKSPAYLGPSSSKGDFVRTAADRHERSSQPEVARHETRDGGNLISHSAPSHSGDWLKHTHSQSLTEAPGTSQQVVPLVTPSALADMGHLYKLPTAPSPSRPQIYQSGLFAPLYTSAAITPQQFPAYASPSAVQVSTVPAYGPYLSGYPLGYPVVAAQGAVGPGPYPTVESYSAMLASMGSQVQQAQGTRLPATTYLPHGVIPLPYGTQLTPGVPGLHVLPKGAVQESLPTVAYINQQLAAPGILQSGPHVLTSLVPVSGGILSFPPRTEDEASRLDQSQEKGSEQEPVSSIQLIRGTGEDRSTQRHSEASPRQTFATQPHVMFDKPEDPRPENLHLAAVERQSVPDRKPYIVPSMRHESVISAIPQGSDKSRPAGQEEHPSGEHSRWAGSAEGTGAYTVSVPPAAQHSPHVRFHLSPSPQARPSPTIVHPPPAETEGGATTAVTTSMPSQMSYLISAAERVNQTPSQPQEMMAHSSTLEPDRSRVQHLLAAPQIPVPPAFSNIPSYFMLGSVIQLASGELKRVEDIRTEDFVQSAEMCEGLKIDSSTVVRISEHADNGVALISFLVGEHKAQVSLEAPMEHPFFVFGQGWSAVKPDRSLKSYHLGCHKLAVGDVCVSLTVKDKNGRWLLQPQLSEQPLSQQQHQQLQSHQTQTYQQLPMLPPQQQQQQQQEIPMQSVFSSTPKELPSWSPEPKRQRLLEPVQEDAGWEDKPDPRSHTSWQREAQQHGSHLESTSQYAFAVPPPVSASVSMEQPAIAGKLTAQTDSNANMVLVRTANTLAQEKSPKLSPRTDGKPLQPLKRRWSDPMHQAQLAAEQEKYGLSTKPTESQ
ncbi:ataxin-1-like [Patiria miniata]|uniref:AXH domain-containing protein n=1 Tax=Patiria miniata TaxID=46514 RepID=A0A914B208_PATMI|nr:ataxin-1-like [Patiria miniata]XP_038070386.1 ataxin-1-like [Patiria miniata]